MRNAILPELPRRLGQALFRAHIETGALVSLGMTFVALGVGLTLGRSIAIMACTGALIASIVDHPGPPKVKLVMFALALGGGVAVNVLTILSVATPWLLALLIAVVSFVIGMISAYGRRAIGLGVSFTLALIFGMMMPLNGSLSEHVACFLGGGVLYSAFALAMAALLEDRSRRMLLAEALRAFAAYAAAKAALYDPRTPSRLALGRLLEAHSGLNEQLQTTRDTIFVGARARQRLRWMAALITLLDCFHTLLSSDADIDILRETAEPKLMYRLMALIADIADDARRLALALVTPGADIERHDRKAQLAALYDEIALWENSVSRRHEPVSLSAFRSTVHKIDRASAYLERLAGAVDTEAGAEAILPAIDLHAFISRETLSPRLLVPHFSLSSPVMRYAVRLTLAMLCGYLLTLTVPTIVHGGWVLLTTALIMRASYSITKTRRNDRIVGTILGCIAAAALVRFLPHQWLFVPPLITVGTAHAFAPVYFVATSFSASITGLLQLFFLMPGGDFVFFERIIDTVVGALLAWLFSFLLPSWEWRNIPKLIAAMVKADRDFAIQAIRLQRSDIGYRLARKRMHDAFANLSSTVRRLADEPQAERATLVALNRLLVANYMLASEIASMRVLFRNRLAELEPTATEAILKQARDNIRATLESNDGSSEPKGHLSRRSLGAYLGGANAAVSLRRRLIHMERAAERVAARAERVRQEMGAAGSSS